MPIVFTLVKYFMSDSQNSNKLILPVFALIAAIAGLFASIYYFDDEDEIKYTTLKLYPSPKAISGFELTNQNNEKITENSFADEWTLIFFGYTHCPDVCPTTLTELQKTFKLLKSEKKPKVLFVSVDPERDNPELLKNYITFFNEDFNAATSDEDNIHKIATQIGVAYYIADHEKGDLNYIVDHTAAIFLINPQKKLHGIFSSPHEANAIATDLDKLLSAES
jgi:protein SCO1/2